MKLRALITIDIDAGDYITAAEHQRRMESILTGIRGDYGQAELQLRERRAQPVGRSPAMVAPARVMTGRLNAYEDL